MRLGDIDLKIIGWLKRSYLPLARLAIFVVYFYFGLLKVIGHSPASPLAEALTARTIGVQYFDPAFQLLALIECVIGILFLLPRATRVVIPLLLVHILIVSSPLLFVADMAWVQPFVPTLEGQYIIKNIAIVALAVGIAAQTQPITRRK